MQTSKRRGPCGRNRARACAWQVIDEGGERGRCTWVPVRRGRRADEQSLVRSPDEADASIGNAMEQRNAERFQAGQEGLENRESRTDNREKIPGLVPPTLYKIFVTVPLFPENRRLNKICDSRCLALPLLMTRRGI